MVLYSVEEAPAQVTLTQLARKRKPAKQITLRKKQAAPIASATSPAPIVATLVPSVYAGDGLPGDLKS